MSKYNINSRIDTMHMCNRYPEKASSFLKGNDLVYNPLDEELDELVASPHGHHYGESYESAPLVAYRDRDGNPVYSSDVEGHHTGFVNPAQLARFQAQRDYTAAKRDKMGRAMLTAG